MMQYAASFRCRMAGVYVGSKDLFTWLDVAQCMNCDAPYRCTKSVERIGSTGVVESGSLWVISSGVLAFTRAYDG